MKIFKIALVLVLLMYLLVLVGCKAETVTTTIKTTVTAPAQTVNVTSTVTPPAVTQTITDTKTVTVNVTASQSTTTPTTTKTTTTTTSTATTTTTIEFTPVTSPDGKLQVITATLTGAGSVGDTDASRIGLRGLVKNLTANETLKAQVTVEFFSSTGSLGSYSTELPITVGPGAEKNYVVETNLSKIAITNFIVSVVVLP
jgi:hypothetical protein